jgi:hypothetical protein
LSVLALAGVVLFLAVSHAAETPPAIIFGKACTIHLAFDTELAIVDDKGFCSFKRSAEAKPLRFRLVPGLADTNMVSLEAVDRPGHYARHWFSRIKVDPKPDKDPFFRSDATFEVRPGLEGNGLRLRSFNWRDCYIGVTHTKKTFIVPDPSPEAATLDIIYSND